MHRFLMPLALVLTGCASLAGDPSARLPVMPDGAPVADWMRTSFALARAERIPPLAASRATAYAAIALYEGLVPWTPELRSLAGQLNGLEELPQPDPHLPHDPATVASVAHAAVLRALYADGDAATRRRIDAEAERQLLLRRNAGVGGAMMQASQEYGERLAAAVIAWSGADGFTSTRSLAYEAPAGPAFWLPTTSPGEHTVHSLSGVTEVVYLDNPSAALSAGTVSARDMVLNRPKMVEGPRMESVNPSRALEPFWGRLRPFVLRSADECAPPPPTPYSEDPSSAFYREVQAVYDATVHLTPDQREIAFFWADNPGQSGTPAGHWVSIMADVSEQERLDLVRAAEVFAVTSIGVADAFISCWRTKYEWSVVRPVTVIHRLMDPAWESLVVTPPFPEYTSGHSVQSAAAAEILTAQLGDIGFTDRTQISLGHEPRTFSSFWEAAREAAISRLYGGIHFPMAIDNGVLQGTCIGGIVADRISTRRDP